LQKGPFHTQNFLLGPLYEGSDSRKISSYTRKHKELQTDAYMYHTYHASTLSRLTA